MKIVGVNISPQADNSHLKALTGGWCNFIPAKTMKFDSAIPPTIKDNPPLSFFFNIYPNLPQINISCIVGHNGSGKSSLIEIILKIINNFSFSSFCNDDEKILSMNYVLSY